jgi:hypothetical protein
MENEGRKRNTSEKSTCNPMSFSHQCTLREIQTTKRVSSVDELYASQLGGSGRTAAIQMDSQQRERLDLFVVVEDRTYVLSVIIFK